MEIAGKPQKQAGASLFPRASRERCPANTFLSDFESPNLRDNTFLSRGAPQIAVLRQGSLRKGLDTPFAGVLAAFLLSSDLPSDLD